MSFNFLDQGFVSSDSYSRNLDRRVAMDEHPYGYDGDEPPAFYSNQGLINEHYKNEVLEAQSLPWDYNKHDSAPEIPRHPKASFPDSEVKGAYQVKKKFKGK